MAEPAQRILKVGPGKHDVLYINHSGRSVEAEVVARGRSGGFNTQPVETRSPSAAELIVDLRNPHYNANAVRIAIPDGHMLVAWGGEDDTEFLFRSFE